MPHCHVTLLCHPAMSPTITDCLHGAGLILFPYRQTLGLQPPKTLHPTALLRQRLTIARPIGCSQGEVPGLGQPVRSCGKTQQQHLVIQGKYQGLGSPYDPVGRHGNNIQLYRGSTKAWAAHVIRWEDMATTSSYMKYKPI